MRETPENLNTQAIELAADGSFPEAVACLKRALSIDQNNYLLWYNLGVTYRNAGELEGAKMALEHAVTLNNEDPDIYESLGLICFSLEEYEDAFAYYVCGLELDQNSAHLWNNLGVLHFAQGQFEEASEAFEEAVTIFPHYYDALFNLRDTYRELGNETGAAICAEKLRNLSPPSGA